MSATGHAAHGGHDAAGVGGFHATRKEYLTGFGLAAVMTAIPFWLTMAHPLGSAGLTAAVVLAFAAAQVVVHMAYFLHMNSRSEGGWTLLALLFTILMVGIVLSGSLWVMYHLDHNMMPISPQDARLMP
jgi:cytochrome o ubiquinol oxidase operon protein cyoD